MSTTSTAAAPPIPPSTPAGRVSRWTLPTLAYAVLVVSALQTLVVPIVHDIGATLGSSPSAAGWVVTANLLAAAVMTPLLGRLGDVRGRRPVLIGILIAMVAGSVLAAATSSLVLLLVARVLQGASYGIFPLAIGVLRDELPARKLTAAMAVVSGCLAIGGGVGLVATGLLTVDHGDYHRVFWLSVVLSIIALVTTAVFVPRRRPTVEGSVDWLGGTVLGAALVLLLLPLSQGNDWGWGSAATLGCFAASALLFAAFVAVEKRVTDPLVSMRMMTHRPIAVTNIAGLFLGAAMFIGFLGATFLVETPPIVGYGFGATVLSASVVYLLPGSLSGILTAPIGGLLVTRFGGKFTLMVAMLCSAAGFGFLAGWHDHSWQVITAAVIVFTGVTFGYAAMPALLVEQVTPAETGIANSVNSIARSTGSSIASALVATVLTRNLIPGLPVPHEQQFVVVFLIGTAGCLLAALVVAFGLQRTDRGRAVVETR
ncbi:MFS transporter [Speluncibacter jeojiensis]|uniref:MFS transporter n=1 Tax=Speluncibacter jeojiensis TaxID=2710754 RepID=A0A9X4RDA0_9ACTN|nr:MFS transporter [Corynebacteriales bacterium D3-21]